MQGRVLVSEFLWRASEESRFKRQGNLAEGSENQTKLKACKEGHSGQSKTDGRGKTTMLIVQVSCVSSIRSLSWGFIPLICTLYCVAALGKAILKDKKIQTQSVHFLGVQQNSICVVAGESRGMCTNLSCFCDGAGVNTAA